VNERAELAQRLELIGAGPDPGGFAQLGSPGGRDRGVGRELRLDDVVGVLAVGGVRSRCGEQLIDAFPLREFRRAADVVGQVLVPGSLPGIEPRFLEGRRDGAGVHPLRPAPDDPATDAGGSTNSRGAATRGASGRRAVRQGMVIVALVFVVRMRSGPPPEPCRRPADT
jgi:hypothetical protein